MKKTVYTPYTYLIGWSKLDKWYYGARYAKEHKCLYETGCHPYDFWVTYHTSSDRVTAFRKEHGEPDVIQIRKTFSNADNAVSWEGRVLKRINAVKRDNWLNGTDGFSPKQGERLVLTEEQSKIISIRTKRGLSQAKDRGVQLGRPNKIEEIKEEIYTLRLQGLSIRKIAKKVSISSGSVRNALEQCRQKNKSPEFLNTWFSELLNGKYTPTYRDSYSLLIWGISWEDVLFFYRTYLPFMFKKEPGGSTVVSKQSKTLTAKQIEIALSYLKDRRNGIRNCVIFLLSVKGGLRAKEISRLRWSMVFTSEGEELGGAIALENAATKGKSGRLIPINKTLKEYLILHRENESTNGLSNFVIQTERSGSTSAQSIVNMFARWYRDLGFDGCSFHSGRRTFITKSIRNMSLVGGSLGDVKQLAGHSSIKSTQRYIDQGTSPRNGILDLV
jgi:integrase/recombinase XerD